MFGSYEEAIRLALNLKYILGAKAIEVGDPFNKFTWQQEALTTLVGLLTDAWERKEKEFSNDFYQN